MQQTCSSRQAIETSTVEILEHKHDSLLQAAALKVAGVDL